MKHDPLLERRSPVGISYALLILTIFFFVMPSAFRAARLSLGQKENDVKDWLPSDFPETAELEWFGDHFAGESFVLATWPGCTRDDQRLRLLQRKLIHESEAYDPSNDFSPELAETNSSERKMSDANCNCWSPVTNSTTGADNERSGSALPSGKWYYITPDGRLYRWEEAINGPAAGIRALKRKQWELTELHGQLVTAFGAEPRRPRCRIPFTTIRRLLCAPLFHTVQTGDSIVDELSREGGALWPIDLTDENRRAEVAQRCADHRLTGTLFSPAMPQDFDWTPAAFRAAVPEPTASDNCRKILMHMSKRRSLSADETFDGRIDSLAAATRKRERTSGTRL